MKTVKDTTLKTLLITGFDPFGGQNINPSWEAVSILPDIIGNCHIHKLQIPTEYERASNCILELASSLKPDVILSVGQAGGRKAVTPEVIGINLREASIPDNAGYQPLNEPVIENAREAYFSTVPIRDMVESIRARNLPAALSYSAGTFVCNDVLYTLLHTFHNTNTLVGFIHVPYLPEQVKNEEPSLMLNEIVDALTACIQTL
ncbi:MAG: pyroglutamyl-peptidase I [Lachnospiraceae bacterium]|nr:pyroglutamyl-peptidase I [Lachnospiraceae bacterium]